MPRKIAIDWDESELRLVAAQCSGDQVKVTDAAVIPIAENENVSQTLKRFVVEHDLQKTETLIAIGRGQAELRQLDLPPVPEDELPDMVRFQAIRNFASASDRATVDYLITNQTSEGTSLIAAAIGPTQLDEIREQCKASDLVPKRIALRPLSAAALYLTKKTVSGDVILIDLLPLDAEIAIARDGKVIFVRTVRLPADPKQRSVGLAGELRRSLLACGINGAPDRVILWGLSDVHKEEVDKISQAIQGTNVDVVDPFELVEVTEAAKATMPKHVGRLAPLVGLLACDEMNSDRLIDFLNPRKRVEVEPDRLRHALLIGGPIAIALLLAFFGYRNISQLNQKIAVLEKQRSDFQSQEKGALQSIAQTESIDNYLDGSVNWLNEMKRVAENLPPSDKLIVRSISAKTDIRKSGGELTVVGGVTDSAVIEDIETSLRDDSHTVVGKGTQKDEKAEDKYSWRFDESVLIDPTFVRNQRYEQLMGLGTKDSTEMTVEKPVATATLSPQESAKETTDSSGAGEAESATTNKPSEPETTSPAENTQPETASETETNSNPETSPEPKSPASETSPDSGNVTQEVEA
ncbi:type IV pilus biogenesis protein PilM [Stieleria varia]|uniref:Competence protein A n=1 Tax=Stieleria varia TaxID=2528005 RepID=A0A5C6B6V1_9BACT|nr:hypothetical protein [Stieleria varia]TWU07688.1 hypothetical protein Pla52n_02610 [Stieleria varia]